MVTSPPQPDDQSSQQTALQTGYPVIIYSSRSQLLDRKAFLKDAWKDLTLAFPLAKRLFLQNIAQRYRYSSLGLFWAFVPSALIAILLTVGQRANIPGLSDGGFPPQVYGIFGVIMMQTFLESLINQRMFLSQYIHLLIRQKIPIESLILAGLGEAFFAFLMRIPVLIAVLIFFNITPQPTALIAPLGFAVIIALGAGSGLLLAPWNALSKDMESLLQFLPWFFFGLTPVFLAATPDSWYYKIFLLNPLTYPFEVIRLWTYGAPMVYPAAFWIVMPVSVVLLLGGWLFCRLSLPYIIERSLN
uniref:ABC-2 type transporter n=1 Tax=Cyanothece sp. (strain PCC 7425 / ATCC 29141) TaxID=395961 RepID=B8HVG0_CYAP4